MLRCASVSPRLKLYFTHLMGELIIYQSLWRPSTFSNISETTGPIELKFHMETP